MVHDGNCAFRAISYGLTGRQGDYLDVKNKINSFIFKNWDFFKDFALDADGKCFANITKYRKYANKKDRMADFSDLVTASHVFNCPITVFRGKDVTYIGEGKLNSRICYFREMSTEVCMIFWN